MNELEQFRTDKTEVPSGHILFEVMSNNGDDKYIWDTTNPTSIEIARETFNKFRAKGFLAYKVTGEKGEKGEMMTEFDKDAGRVIFSPPMKGG